MWAKGSAGGIWPSGQGCMWRAKGEEAAKAFRAILAFNRGGKVQLPYVGHSGLWQRVPGRGELRRVEEHLQRLGLLGAVSGQV